MNDSELGEFGLEKRKLREAMVVTTSCMVYSSCSKVPNM